jgi:hypothetical protein
MTELNDRLEKVKNPKEFTKMQNKKFQQNFNKISTTEIPVTKQPQTRLLPVFNRLKR